jgi:hypothetical protein
MPNQASYWLWKQGEEAMIHNLVDIASRVSPRLSALIEGRVNDPDEEQPVTLSEVRTFLSEMLSDEYREAEQLHRFDLGDSMLDELDALIEEFGEGALAIDFAQHTASEALTQVIEAVMDDDSRDNPPTLETVREAVLAGLPSSLLGDGALEEDESETLLAEIDAMIERFGSDALAEGFLCFE